MPLLRTRRLLLHRGDFRRCAWYRDRRPPPAPPKPAGLSFTWLEERAWRERPGQVVCAPGLAGQRFAQGGRCLVGIDEHGATAYEMWVLRGGSWTDWIGALVTPPPGYALFAGAWTRPDHRQKWVMRYGGVLGFAEVVRLGLHGMYAGIEEPQVLRRAERNAKSGLFALEPDRVLVHRQWLGLSWHSSEAPDPELVRACAATVARYPEHFPAG